jgi:hypothetical protein
MLCLQQKLALSRRCTIWNEHTKISGKQRMKHAIFAFSGGFFPREMEEPKTGSSWYMHVDQMPAAAFCLYDSILFLFEIIID